MQMISTLKPMPVGKRIAVFTNMPEPVGGKIYFTDTNGKPFNVARITDVKLSSDLNVNGGKKYCVQAIVEEDLSTKKAGELTARVYWN